MFLYLPCHLRKKHCIKSGEKNVESNIAFIVTSRNAGLAFVNNRHLNILQSNFLSWLPKQQIKMNSNKLSTPAPIISENISKSSAILSPSLSLSSPVSANNTKIETFHQFLSLHTIYFFKRGDSRRYYLDFTSSLAAIENHPFSTKNAFIYF